MVQHQKMTTGLLILCILAFLACSHASNARGPFGFRNSPSMEVSPKRSPFWWSFHHANPRAALLQIRGGDPSTKTIDATDGDDGGNEKKTSVESEPVVETPSNIAADEEPINVAQAIEEIEESSDLDTDDEMAEAMELASDADDEEEEDFYTDSEDSDASDYEAMIDDVEDEDEENPALELAIDTAAKVSKLAGVLAIKFSKGASYWIRQWSWDIYRACERAVDACREEVAEGAFRLTLSKAELKDATKAQIFRKKSWKATKCTCTTVIKMTKAFWTMDDNDILPEDDDDSVMSILPKFSFLDKFRLRSDVEEQEVEDEEEEEIIEPAEKVEEETCKSESILRKKLRKKRIKKKKKKKAAAAKKKKAATSQTTVAPAPKEEKAVVTVIPRVQKTRRVIIGVAVGVVGGFLWQEVGAAALIAKGLSALPWKKSDSSKEKS